MVRMLMVSFLLFVPDDLIQYCPCRSLLISCLAIPKMTRVNILGFIALGETEPFLLTGLLNAATVHILI